MADGACVCWGVVWCLVLWFIGWPIAGFCAGFYILLLPFTVCIDGLKVTTFLTFFSKTLLLNYSLCNLYLNRLLFFFFQGLTDFLLKGIQLPHFCATHMMKGTPLGDAMK